MENELKSISIDSTIHDFFAVYTHNKKVVGQIKVHTELYSRYIKLLSIMPLKDKKLETFLSLSSVAKAGFMSKYLIKCAKSWKIPQTYIKSYIDSLESWKFSKRYYEHDETERHNRNINMVRENVKLCDAVFEMYDVGVNQHRERKLKRILED